MVKNMNNVALAAVLSLGLVAASAPAKADNAAGIGIFLGGLFGGLVLGEAIHQDHHERYNHTLVRQCETRWSDYYDYRQGVWVSQPHRECWLVQQN
jgi:hypothetical protein